MATNLDHIIDEHSDVVADEEDDPELVNGALLPAIIDKNLSELDR